MTRPRYGATADDIADIVATAGQPGYRARQIYDGLWTQRTPLDQLTSLPKQLRADLEHTLPLSLGQPIVQRSRDNATVKWLWRAHDGAQVETVLMRSPRRATVCVSSQAGCAMGCTFCATGQAGFERHLRADEIVEQVVRAQHDTDQRVSNVVFMGMGEPLANVDEVWSAVERLHADLGLSARHITISTVGVVPGIRALIDAPLPVTLAVSLHAPNDELRRQLVPLDKRYPIDAVLDAAAAVARARGRRVTFEYALIDEVNDRLNHADELADLLNGFPGPGGAHVNLIPLNPTGGFEGKASHPGRAQTFRDRLLAQGIQATIRRNRGVDIDAACGQLRARASKPDDVAVGLGRPPER